MDDDDSVRRTMVLQLRSFGCIPAVFELPEPAVAEILRKPDGTDVVLSDVHMPGMSGWELLQAVRAGAGPKPPVLLVSGRPFERPDGVDHEPEATLRKPYGLTELFRAVQSALARARPG